MEYLVQPGLKEQIYDLRLFLFFPAELDAASTSFFASLFESVRLHTPTVRAIPMSILSAYLVMWMASANVHHHA